STQSSTAVVTTMSTAYSTRCPVVTSFMTTLPHLRRRLASPSFHVSPLPMGHRLFVAPLRSSSRGGGRRRAQRRHGASQSIQEKQPGAMHARLHREAAEPDGL